LLPRVVEPGAVVAPLTPGICARFGLPRDAVAVAGTTDGCAAFLATGAAEAGDGVTSLGSTLTIKLLSDTPVFAPRFGIYSHRLGGWWLPGGASNTGGAALLRHFDAATIARLSAGIDPSRDSGLDYYPLPAPGERFPIADAAMPPRETPRPADDAAFLHGLLEGIGRIEALAYARLADLGAPPLRRLRSVGGGAGNAAWTALRARILGVELAQARSEDAAVGTAGLALRALA
jgi:sugar (pentulose or hexulose) kinase